MLEVRLRTSRQLTSLLQLTIPALLSSLITTAPGQPDDNSPLLSCPPPLFPLPFPLTFSHRRAESCPAIWSPVIPRLDIRPKELFLPRISFLWLLFWLRTSFLYKN